MKKFYYSREASHDEPSHSFHLDHLNIMDVNNGQGRGMSGRAASVNSLDLLSEAPTIPRVTARDVTRSMSDVESKAKPNLITETELSSSWLYKTMQASINARFKSPRKSPSVHKMGDLEQSILKDPELKPIPVKSKAAKTSSCICHFATMIAISLCTVGFLASVAAIIYMEIFANRNITFLHSDEAEVDISDVMFDSREVYNLTTQKLDEGHVLNEALTHRFDGDEETLNDILKTSSTNDIPNLLNASKNHGRFADYVTETGNSEKTELRQYINDTNSKIKFQDDVTVIYEMKLNESSVDDVEENLSMEFKGRSFSLGYDQDEDTSEDGFEKSAENNLNDNLKQQLGIDEKPDGVMFKDSVPFKHTESLDKQPSDFKLTGNELKEDLKEIVSEVFKFNSMSGNVKTDDLEKNEPIKQTLEDGSSEQLNSSDIHEVKDVEKTPNSETNESLEGDRTDHNEFEKLNGNITQKVEDSDSALTNFLEFQTVQYEDEVFQSTLKGSDQTVTDDYDVNTMLVTVDDTEASSDSFMSKRNGEMNFFQVSSPVPSVEPVKQINGDSSILSKKPGDIKGSLADAMKHLQKLDVNNILLTSRTKPKQKVNTQKPKRKSVSNEERKRYLQRMRLMLFKHLQ